MLYVSSAYLWVSFSSSFGSEGEFWELIGAMMNDAVCPVSLGTYVHTYPALDDPTVLVHVDALKMYIAYTYRST